MRNHWLAGALGAAVFTASAASLTLDEAQRLAVARSRQLAAQDFAIEASQRMAQAAGERPDPVLKLGVENVPAEGGDRFSVARDFMTMRRVGVMQEFTSGDKLSLRRERYEREADKGRAERLATVASVQRDTGVAWAERYYAEASRAVLEEQARTAALEIDAADAAYRAGKGAQADVFAARGAFAMLQDREAEAAARVGTARLELARWTGSDPATPLAAPPAWDSLPLPPSGLGEHLAGHPEVTALERQVEIAEAEARLADAARKPDWTWEAAYQVRGPAYANMFSVGVSIPLAWDAPHRQDQEAAARRAQAGEALAKRDEMLRAHVDEVLRMRVEWLATRERIARYRREIVPFAAERTQAALAAYSGARGTLADVLAARRGEAEARLNALQLERDSARLWARLVYLLPNGDWK